MRNRILLVLLVGVLVAECDRREPPAVFRYPNTGLAIRIERTPMHAFLAEYRRTLVVDREGREVVRRVMFSDSGGYSRVNVYDVGTSDLLLLSAFDVYLVNSSDGSVRELDRLHVTPNGAYLGAFASDEARRWRFVPASEAPELSIEPRGG